MNVEDFTVERAREKERDGTVQLGHLPFECTG